MIALESRNTAQTGLQDTQKQVPAGYRFANIDKIDRMNNGLNSLIDADLTKESAQLQALQMRQQRATVALSPADQAPQALLSLLR